jgi:hypothetical protein
MIIEVSSLPKKKILDPYFPTKKTKNGKISVPFLDLPTGLHDIEFRTSKKYLKCQIKHWLSMFGYAWEITQIYEKGLIDDGT